MLTNPCTNELGVFDRKIIKKIYDWNLKNSSFARGKWKILQNYEINVILLEDNIVWFIKSRRTDWNKDKGDVKKMQW